MKYVILSALAMTALHARTIEVRSLYQPAPLDGVWKFSAGDDPRFAAPEYDDSAWQTIRVPNEEIPLHLGFCWIRFHIQLPEQRPAEPLALLLQRLSNAYDVFVNGKLVGSFGNLRVENGWGDFQPAAAAFAIPSGSRQMTIAIRSRRSSQLIRVPSASRSAWIGTAEAIAATRQKNELEVRWRSLNHLTTMSAIAMAGFFFLLLPIWRRDAKDYFWCGCFLIIALLLRPFAAMLWMLEGLAMPLISSSLFGLLALWLYCWERLFHHLLGVRLSTWAGRCLNAGLLLMVALCILSPFLPFGRIGPLLPVFVLVAMISQLGVYLDMARRSQPVSETPWMHMAVAIYFGGNFANSVLMDPRVARMLPYGVEGHDFALIVRSVGTLLFVGVMAAIMNRRSARIEREQQRLAQEMRAGAEMQELLLPANSIQVPGLATESAYLPMSEVGGDFHWARAESGGSLIVVVGDVSGKGLKAAMMVSVAIGILRNEKSSSPGAILAALNESLAGNVGGGFVTCCCARFDPDGRVTIANAGHPSPYADGRELEVEGGLPLGVAQGVVYCEMEVSGKYFTFVSDGVVEAENNARELFGFDRTREISGKSAQGIAGTVKAWGQTDDITVVTVKRRESIA